MSIRRRTGALNYPKTRLERLPGSRSCKKGHGVVYIPAAQALIAGGHLELPMPTPGRLAGRVTVGGQIAANQEVHIEPGLPTGR